MAADKDVRLVIKARNEATKAIDSVADALKQLSESQKKTGQSAKQMESVLGALGAEFQRLTKEAAALSALGRISSELDRATAAVKRLEEAARSSSADFERLKADTDQAASATARLKAQAEALTNTYNQQKNAVREARREQAAANEELRKAEAMQRRVATSRFPISLVECGRVGPGVCRCRSRESPSECRDGGGLLQAPS